MKNYFKQKNGLFNMISHSRHGDRGFSHYFSRLCSGFMLFTVDLCVSGQCLHLLHCDVCESISTTEISKAYCNFIKDATWKGRVCPIKHEDSGLDPFKKFPAYAPNHSNEKL